MKSSKLRRRRQAPASQRNRRLPRTTQRRGFFEPLEDRRLLAITVNTAVDEHDGSILDGDVSLRDAIAAAAVGETINFNAALNGATINLTLGELVIDRSLTIDASGLPLGVTIDASGNDPTPAVNNGDGSRVFRITDGTAADLTVELRGLTITGGDVTGSGGGIQNFERLTLVKTKVQANSARGGQGSGGGVWSQNATNLTIRDSALTGNAATLAGGGLWARVAGGDTLSLFTSTISGNTAGTAGGGVYAYTSDAGRVTIQDSTASGNTAGSDGGGMYLRTTFGGASNVIQNTVSGNSARWRGGGMFVMSVGVTTSVRFNTITANTADSDANNPVIETGGGIYASGTGTLKLEQSIVAANIDTGNHAPDLKIASGTLQTGYNLIGTNGGSGLAPAPIAAPDASGNIVGGAGAAAISPGLEPLGNNGGLTLTHALSPLSAAVNRGNPVYTPGNSTQGVPLYDQRGNPFGRVQAGPGPFRIDIGAFEVSDLVISTLVVDSIGDNDDGNTSAGNFTLREAFRIAHQLATVPTISFAASLSGGTIELTAGELLVARQLTIDGTTLAAGIGIDANGLSRVFHINGIGNATLKGLKLTGATEAIKVEYGGLAEVVSGLIEGNSAGISAIGPITVKSSVIRNNTGGGIVGDTHLSLLVEDSSIVDNGGIGIFMNNANATIRRSTISGNAGDGITSTRQLTIEKSTIANNSGNGVSKPAGGFELTITDSTIHGNTGAGVYVNTAESITITNCTVSNNGNRGVAAPTQFAQPITIRHSTIIGNTGGRGAGVWSQYRSAKIFNSIISGNTDLTGYEHDVMAHEANLYYSLVGRRNPGNPYGPPIDRGGSIIGTNASPVDPLLGPLANNGGPTLTHMLLPGSPAINAGDPTLTAGVGTTPQLDQRGTGFGRIAEGRIDMGAVEAGSILNTSPAITSPSAVNVPENSTTALTVTVSDPDLPPQTMTFSIIGGADATKLEFAPGGVLNFKTAPDYEAPSDANADRVYLIEIRVEDGVGGAATQMLSLTVTAVNDNNPVFQSPSSVLVPEGTTPVTPLTATDADLPVQLITYSIVGGADGDKFAISPGGALSFIDAPAHDMPTDADGNNVYVVDVEASDGAGGKTTQTISVNVQSSLPPTADFNRDSMIDGDDLPIWTRNYGATNGPEPTPGDADGDHDADGHDFLAWQRTLGTVVPPAMASVAAMAPASETTASDVLSPSVAKTAATQRSHRQQVHLGANVVLGNEPSTRLSAGTSLDARISHDRLLLYDGSPDSIHWHVRAVALTELTSGFAALRASRATDIHDVGETGLADNDSLDELWQDEELTLSLRR